MLRSETPLESRLDKLEGRAEETESGARAAKSGATEELDNEEQAELESEVLRTEVQPKCIKGGIMREYQVRPRTRAAL